MGQTSNTGSPVSAAEAETYMRQALNLAAGGAGFVAPNPMVGAVLVAQGRIIGQGYHRVFGSDHAEVDCINSVAEDDKHLIPESDMFVTLEPCSHFGKTPPCADRIVKEKIPRVWIACKDDFALVNGQGIQKLKDAGVDVMLGILEKEAIELNRRFFCFHQHKRPYIILKWAQSNDGFIGKKGERVFISNEWSLRLVHKWRSEEASILVGINTAIIDNPQLTDRFWGKRQPVRIVLDRQLKLPESSALYQENRSWIYNLKEDGKGEFFERIKLNEEGFIPAVLNDLYKRGINSVLVEGGARIHQAFIDLGLWDEARIITNTEMKLEDGVKAASLPPGILNQRFLLKNDKVEIWRNPETLKTV